MFVFIYEICMSHPRIYTIDVHEEYNFIFRLYCNHLSPQLQCAWIGSEKLVYRTLDRRKKYLKLSKNACNNT